MNQDLYMHICHLTSAHPRNDSRIFLKMCKGLAKRGKRVSLIVADGIGDEHLDGVNIFDVGIPKNRLRRMLYSTQAVYKKALDLKADIFHVHDPELLLIALKLSKSGAKVVFDSHEDMVKTILVSPYLPSLSSKIISKVYEVFERFVCKRIAGVIGATPHIESLFKEFAKNTVYVNNYPILGRDVTESTNQKKKAEICYVGSIDVTRGIDEIMSSLELVKGEVNLNLAGQYSTKALETRVKKSAVYCRIRDYGYVGPGQVSEIYKNSIAGIVTLHPIPTFLVSLPIKIFEYMEAGLPFIISDFPYWREMLKGYNCCVFVNPLDPGEIAGAIDFYLENRVLAQEMGAIGKKLVYEKFNWKQEEEKLIGFYELII